MEKEAKKYRDISENPAVSRKGEGTALRESERILSLTERVYLQELMKKGGIDQPKNLNVWYVPWSSSPLKDNFREKSENNRQQLNKLEDSHNSAVRKADGKTDEREYRFWQKDHGDLNYALKETFKSVEAIREIPEVIIIQSEDSNTGAWSALPENIDKSIEQLRRKVFKYQEELVTFYLQNASDVYWDHSAGKFAWTRVPLTEESLIDYGFQEIEIINQEEQNRLFTKYIYEKDEKYIREFFSDEVLREIYDYMCTYDERAAESFADDLEPGASQKLDRESEFFQEFHEEIDHEKLKAEWWQDILKRQQEGDEYPMDLTEDDYDKDGVDLEVARENYLDWRKSIAEAAKKLDFEKIKGGMREKYVAILKQALNKYAGQIIAENDAFEAEKKLLKPVLVYVSKNAEDRELMRNQGAEIVLDDLPFDDMQKLIDFIARAKASAASLVPEKVRREKSAFYRSVEDKLDSRSEVTADTEKEVAILEDIFRKNGNVKKVLDVACGNGRIDIPLLEKGLEVTGLDGNEQFLQSALRKVLEKDIKNAQFKKGDVIDFKNVVEHASQDAVIYTWHSILEAFGPGNLLQTLGDAWWSLRQGGTLVFDQPTRNNPGMEDGWYGNDPDSGHHYLSYIMDEEEIRFVLKMAGFENVEIQHWKTQPSAEYPEGMDKFTVSARKQEMDEDTFDSAKSYVRMVNGGK